MQIYDNWKKIAQRLEIAKTKKDPRLEFYTPEDTQAYIKSKNVSLNINVFNEETDLKIYRSLNVKDKMIAVDLETTGLDPRKDKIVSIALSVKKEDSEKNISSYFIDWISYGKDLRWFLEQILYNNVIIFHNAKFDLSFLSQVGYDIDRIDIRDSMLSAYIDCPGSKVNLKHLAAEILEFHYDSFEVMAKGRDVLDIPKSELAQYNCSDSLSTLKLEEHFEKKRTLEEDTIYHLELAVCRILTKMELWGISINKDLLIQLKSENQTQLDSILESIKSHFPNLNINSSIQLREVLYHNLKVPTNGIKITKSGFSTDEESLQKALLNCENDIQKTVLSKVLEYRKLKKIQSAYVIGLLDKVTERQKIHTNFNQALTVTGRLSSSKPNLQNVPKFCRKAFTTSKDKKLVAIDYSQCEVRILAHFTQDPVLLKAFNADLDPHLEVAKQLLKKDNITSEERRICKTINFGIIYGMDASKLAIMSGYPLNEAKKFLKEYWHSFPSVSEWMNKVYIDVLTKGYTTTLLGRKRHFTFYNQSLIKQVRELFARSDSIEDQFVLLSRIMSNFSEYERKILREAGNAPIQGSNADITKLAMIAAEKEIKKRSFDANLLLQIHDELVWEVNKSQVADFIDTMEQVMVNVIQLSVPLKVDSHYGDTWEETK